MAKKIEVKAEIIWLPEDIKTLKPEWTMKKCREWLDSNKSTIQDRSIELGWDIINDLL